MGEIKVKNIFAAVFEKSVLDELLEVLRVRSGSKQASRSDPVELVSGSATLINKFWGTEGTINYVKAKGFWGESVIWGFDFDGRVKSLDRANFVRILADKSKSSHQAELKKEKIEPFDLVIVDLYAPDPKIFPESMDIGGQSLIRAAIKNYENVALAFDEESIMDLVKELKQNQGSITLAFRKKQAKKAARFIAGRTKLEADLFEKLD